MIEGWDSDLLLQTPPRYLVARRGCAMCIVLASVQSFFDVVELSLLLCVFGPPSIHDSFEDVGAHTCSALTTRPKCYTFQHMVSASHFCNLNRSIVDSFVLCVAKFIHNIFL